MVKDSRFDALQAWLGTIPRFDGAQIEPLAGDASFRRYFRVITASERVVAMDAPPEREDCGPFIAIGSHWHAQGIRVPAILERDDEQGFLLLEDLGDDLLLGSLSEDTVDHLYTCAIDELIRLQALPASDRYPLPHYDQALLQREMALFPDWLLTRQLGMTLDTQEQSLLTCAFNLLEKSALNQPQVTVHRDYHSRNLLVLPGEDRPGVIDFQDAVRGPVTYDLVSLLKDCYVRWPDQQVAGWRDSFYSKAVDAGLLRCDLETFTQWFELMGMQRHLKAAGIFARLAMRDGKQRYLADIPRVLGYLLDASARQPALQGFHGWLKERIEPAVTGMMILEPKP